ncbi:MAG: hypothetical protein K2Q23_09975 [Bryobacteraceae bacterium]|nr:hypothetical protein [Bryobacteraceae bacterium]
MLLTACGPGGSAPPEPPVLPVKITQFYAAPNLIGKGEKAMLCYGVESAAKVEIEPRVEAVWPALSRCVEVAPTADTEYRFLATGRDGRIATASAKITVGAARPPAPKFTDLRVSATQVKPGELISFCFSGANGTKVSGGPGRFQKGGLPAGDCLIDQPRRTTTYRLELTGAGGADSASTTVTVP